MSTPTALPPATAAAPGGIRRARELLRRGLRRLLPGLFPAPPDFDEVSRLAAIQRSDLQYYMDIQPGARWHSPEFVARFGGFHPPGETRRLHELHAGDRVRANLLLLLLREITVRKVPGCLAELGVHRGESARLIHHYCPERTFYLFDTFAGFSDQDLAAESVSLGFNQAQQFTDTNLDLVRNTIAPLAETLVPVVGWFPASVTPAVAAARFAFVHLDADLEAPIAAGLDFFWPRLNAGGYLVVHDYNAWPGARLAVDRFRTAHPVAAVPMPDKSGSIVLVRT
ncbi:MAG: class I SAM-dependent methyltransferase [Verrucomicrobia bacterium]|nr:class I SAM-dependent methyltransferase [Verrucomicrobiota bacterium]